MARKKKSEVLWNKEPYILCIINSLHLNPSNTLEPQIGLDPLVGLTFPKSLSPVTLWNFMSSATRGPTHTRHSHSRDRLSRGI